MHGMHFTNSNTHKDNMKHRCTHTQTHTFTQTTKREMQTLFCRHPYIVLVKAVFLKLGGRPSWGGHRATVEAAMTPGKTWNDTKLNEYDLYRED